MTIRLSSVVVLQHSNRITVAKTSNTKTRWQQTEVYYAYKALMWWTGMVSGLFSRAYVEQDHQ